MKRGIWYAGSVFVLLVVSCTNPLVKYGLTDTRRGFGRVMVSTGILGARTVIPDFDTAIDSFEVVLSSRDGYASQSATVTVPATSHTFDSVETGTWDITVTAEKSGNTVAGGSAPGQKIDTGTTLNVTVPVTFSQSGGTGDLSLAVSFPASTGIDYVDGAVDGGAAIVPVLTETAAGQMTGTFEQNGLPAGSHDLVMTFRRGGAGGTVAGEFREAVNIWANETSDMWLDASGQPVAVRVFSAEEFQDATAALANLQTSAGSIGFFPTTMHYEAGAVSSAQVTIEATESLPGQYIQYRLNGGGWIELQSAVSSAAILLTPGANTIDVHVTAPDRVTSTTYSIDIGRGFLVTYDGNGSTSGTVPADATIYLPADDAVVLGPGSLSNATYTFAGWNTEADDSGADYAVGSSVTIGSSAVTLYAAWQVAAPSFSLPAGTYNGAQTVTISSATPNASIRYTLDGSEPTPTHGTLGTSAEVAETSTLKAIAFESGRVESAVTEASYVLTGTLAVAFTISTPDFQAITFQSTDVSVPRGDMLELTTTNDVLTGLSGWQWYVGNELDPTQASSTFVWDTTGKQPGQYIINVTVVYGGVEYSGSLRVTITY